MNPEVKAKWVAALRSGEYKQGKYALHNDSNEYCCLGVLCAVAIQENAEHVWRSPDPIGTGYTYNNEVGVAPSAVQTWAGIASGNPSIPGVVYNPDTKTFIPEAEAVDHPHLGPGTCSLAELNDDLNFNFHQIADIIERYM